MNYFSSFNKSRKRLSAANNSHNKANSNVKSVSFDDEKCDEVKLTNFNRQLSITHTYDNNDELKSRTLDDKRLCPSSGIKRFYSAPNSDAYWAQAKRKAIFVQMYDTEKSYVEALKSLVNKYYLPLKERDIVEENLLNDIFYKIPEIHVHHELLLSMLKTKFDLWDSKQTIGDIILNIFGKQSVIETYISFVNNYKLSQESFQICKDQSSLFNKFIEQQAKDHRGKLTLKDLIIQPVQRIPRYELYIKDFLKCTSITHPDYQFLLKAQKELHNLAERIDQVTKENSNEINTNDNKTCLQIIQDLIENLDDLVTDNRVFIRHDMISVVTSSGYKKDRCIFLFSDLVLLTSCKRTSGNISKRNSSIILNTTYGKQYLESMKYKLTARYSLEHIDLVFQTQSKSIENDHLANDLKLIEKINELSKCIVFSHQTLDESIKNLMNDISKQLNDSVFQNNRSNDESDTNQNHTRLALNLPNDHKETLTFQLVNIDKRCSWEKSFIDTKRDYEENYNRKLPLFINALSVPKNRSGMKFTCAAPRVNLANEPGHVWICSTDGQMGQVCLMNTSTPEISIASCNTVSSSRITCILCVPPKDKILKKISSTSDTESSDDENDTQINHHISNELKYSTMWIGCDDGCINIFQFTDSTFRTTSKRNRTTKELSSGLLAIAYHKDRVFISLCNCDLVILTRSRSGIWNLDNLIRKKLTQRPITSIITVDDKLWCTYSNCILILDPTTLLVDNNFGIDNETSLLMCNSEHGVWVIGQTSLDIRLYHSKKYSIQNEMNLRQNILNVLSSLDELIKIHKQSCLKISCVHLCKDTLWLGTTTGLIVTLKIKESLLNQLNPYILPIGHTGPVRFITSITKMTLQRFKSTFVITGGEGYQEYKIDIPQNFTSMSQSFNDDHASDDLTNYTLIWEI